LLHKCLERIEGLPHIRQTHRSFSVNAQFVGLPNISREVESVFRDDVSLPPTNCAVSVLASNETVFKVGNI
jgi:hypothetical protein